MRTRLVTGALALALALVVAGCGGAGSTGPGDDGKLSIVATTTQLTDFATVIGGDRVHVTGILKPNVDAHDFEPSPADVDAVARAPILIENGFGLEQWLQETITTSGFDGTRVVAGEGVTPIEGDGGQDPHIWQSAANAKVMVANIERALAKADPAGAATYKANLDAYLAKLDALDHEVRTQVATIPPADRKLVTNHEAFNYYANAYGFEVVGAIIPSFDTAAELSAKEISELVAKIKATGTRAVFSEASLPPQTAETIAKEAGVRVVAGEDALYGDSLGPAGSAGGTYLDMMRHNTKVIVDNLR